MSQHTFRHGVGNPVRSADSRAGQKVRVNSNQSDCGRFHSVARRLNLVQRMCNVNDDRLRLGANNIKVKASHEKYLSLLT